MAASPLPPHLVIAHVSTTTPSARSRFLEIFPPLATHCKESEPDTLSYYFFNSTSEDDHSLYGFEAYPTKAALFDVHATSDVYKNLGAIVQQENLCAIDVDLFKPVGGFILRGGQVERPVGVVLINKFPSGSSPVSGDRLKEYARYVEGQEKEGCPTFVVMEHEKTGDVWTFERYTTREFYEQTHRGSKAFADLFGEVQAGSTAKLGL
ncbi:hypothetical protein SODALDRAFT_374336 [Sodiomyces alkalinus F11]|uniref:ABM domain-containing protein n=1 Tax=Sodiomyces alkalinus (strain CBS 110278 / VKM F-3762 / F11) TaxID=1314773 RepID=A0A3N2Q5F9_SODAK|nr:hypothetical protein SODALDRAFT_374336 [Sodiomyces alkalinus F11]ROT41936.1 hypothetical protein SODALDRAFT_374336 [Sodiomyces alkalinus F11]